MPSGKKSKRTRQVSGGAPASGSPRPPSRSRQSSWRDRRWLIGGGGVALIAVIAIAVVVATRGGGGSSKPTAVDFGQMVNLQTSAPPWNSDSGDLESHLSDVDLTAMSSEALAFHIHSHLDLYVNGKKVAVPASIGISQTFITAVHTHTPDGVIHVESPVNKDYTLGQFFGEWGVRLTSSCVGTYCGDLEFWVDGTRGTGDPAAIVLAAHKEIVIAHGQPPAKIPSRYAFPEGE